MAGFLGVFLLLPASVAGCLGGTSDHAENARSLGEPTLVFSSDRDGPLQLYRLDPGTGSVSRLTRTARDERDPCVSPDGTRVVHASVGNRESDLYALELDGDAPVRLTETGRASEPSISPDGRTIAFTSTRDGASAIWTVRADGADPSRLSPRDAWDRSPAYSPDGSRIAFVSRVGGDSEIFVMAADGSGRRRLTRNAGDDSQPAWSPDGRRLVYASSASGKHDGLVLLDLDSGTTQDLIESRSLRGEYMDRNVASWGARFSPDGERLVFCSLRDGNAELYEIGADGTNLRRLTDDPGQDLAPAWIPSIERAEKR